METWEWPLVLFTVLGQMAVGIIICLWFLNRTIDQKLFKNAVLASGILLGLAMGISTFHLGHPFAAYRALTHLSTSWLSREILLFILTFAAWGYLFWLSTKPGKKVAGALGITASFGVLGIISSALIYTLPRVPAWNNAGPILFFLLTTVILGTLTVAMLGRKTLKQEELRQLLQIALGGIIVSVILFILYFSLLGHSLEGAATVETLMGSALFWLRGIVGWLLPAIVLLTMGIKKDRLQPQIILLLFGSGLVGEFLGRALFYASAVGIHITARM